MDDRGMPANWGVKMALESSGSERTIHALNVDDMLLDKWDQEQPRGEGGAGRGDWSRISGKSTRGKLTSTSAQKDKRGTFIKKAREKAKAKGLLALPYRQSVSYK